jgi:hypothetical protein
MPPTLYGVLEKRNWAERHLKLIEQFIGEFFDSDPYSIMTDRDPENGVYHARLVYPKQLPARPLSLMIGDCIHNMRSALDYMAWELAGADIANMETMFPIFDTEAGFKTRGLKRIKRLPKNAQTAIERLQPYNTSYGGDLLALSAINKIDATDKHKVLTVAIAIADHVVCHHGVPEHMRTGRRTTAELQIFSNARLIHNAKIATFTIAPPIPEMEVDFKFTPKVTFGHLPGFPKVPFFVLHNLHLMLGSIDTAIKRLKPFF